MLELIHRCIIVWLFVHLRGLCYCWCSVDFTTKLRSLDSRQSGEFIQNHIPGTINFRLVHMGAGGDGIGCAYICAVLACLLYFFRWMMDTCNCKGTVLCWLMKCCSWTFIRFVSMLALLVHFILVALYISSWICGTAIELVLALCFFIYTELNPSHCESCNVLVAPSS